MIPSSTQLSSTFVDNRPNDRLAEVYGVGGRCAGFSNQYRTRETIIVINESSANRKYRRMKIRSTRSYNNQVRKCNEEGRWKRKSNKKCSFRYLIVSCYTRENYVLFDRLIYASMLEEEKKINTRFGNDPRRIIKHIN